MHCRFSIADCQFDSSYQAFLKNRSIGNRQLAIDNVEWYRRRDSNPHCLVSKTSASSRLGYAGIVNPAGLEPATCRLGNRVLIPSDLLIRGGPKDWLRRQDLNLCRRIMSPSLAALRLQCTPRQTDSNWLR